MHTSFEVAGTCRPLVFSAYVLLLCGSSGSKAEETPDWRRAQESLGAAVVVIEQPYRDVRPTVVPVPWINWRWDRLHIDGMSAGYDLAQKPSYTMSLVIQPRFDQVSAGESPDLSAIRSRSMSLDGGVSVGTRYAGISFSLSAVHDTLGKSHGSVLAAGLSKGLPYAGSWWVLSTGIDWEDRRSTNYYFGVSPSEAGPSRPAYSPASAVNAHVGVFCLHPLGGKWTAVLGTQYTKLGHSIADSPLVGSDYGAIFVLGATYDFAGNRP